jgi:hypothetical protein
VKIELLFLATLFERKGLFIIHFDFDVLVVPVLEGLKLLFISSTTIHDGLFVATLLFDFYLLLH